MIVVCGKNNIFALRMYASPNEGRQLKIQRGGGGKLVINDDSSAFVTALEKKQREFSF